VELRFLVHLAERLGMRFRVHLMVLALACALAPGLVSGAVASAASLSVSVEEVQYKQEWNVTVTGETEQASTVMVHVANADQPCDYLNANGPYARISVPAGPFSSTKNVRDTSGTFKLGTNQVVCGVIYYDGYGGQPVATASAPVKVRAEVHDNNVILRGGGQFECTADSNAHCEPAGRMDVLVSSLIRKRLKLPTTELAGATIRRYGLTFAARPKGSAATAKRLKASALAARGIGKGNLDWGMEEFPVKVVITLTAPFARTFTEKASFHVNSREMWDRSEIAFAGGPYLCIPASGPAKFMMPRTCATG
jgi:hypothetical protein